MRIGFPPGIATILIGTAALLVGHSAPSLAQALAPGDAQPYAPSAAAGSEHAGERISLKEALQRALARNPTVATALAELRRAEALMEQARAPSLPTLSANGVYTRLDSDRLLQGRVISPENQLSANLTLNVPLVMPQRWAQWSRASDAIDVARASADDMRRQVALLVGRDYLTIVAQRRVVEVNERARDAAKSHFEFAHSRYAGGVGNRLDEVRAQQEMETNEARVQAAYAALFRAREALGVLLAMEGPVDAADEGHIGEPPTLASALDGAGARRSDIIALRMRLWAAERSEHSNWTEFSPYLVGQFQPFYQNPPTLVQPQTGWQAQIALTVPLYDGGLRYGLIHERSALSAEARVGLQGAIRQAKSDVRVAVESLHRAEDALQAAQNAGKLAEEALALATLAYRVGTTTNLEVIDAERRARDAQTDVAIAEDTARQAQLDLLIAGGSFP